MPQEKTSAKSKNDDNELVPITLRIPRPVHAQLKQLSEAEFRSLNHQVILALSYFLELHGKFGGLPHPEALRKALPASPMTLQPWFHAAGKQPFGTRGE